MSAGKKKAVLTFGLIIAILILLQNSGIAIDDRPQSMQDKIINNSKVSSEQTLSDLEIVNNTFHGLLAGWFFIKKEVAKSNQ